MNNEELEELLEAMKRQQQHTLMEIHLSAEDTKEHFDEKIDKIEVRVTALEHFRTAVDTWAKWIGMPVVGGIITALGTLFYKFLHLGERLK